MNDEQIAQAVAGYLEKVGIKVNLNLMPKSNFFTYIKPAENKSMLLQTGWSDASGDGLSLLHDMLRTYNREAGQGTVNRGHYSNPEVDALSARHLRNLTMPRGANWWQRQIRLQEKIMRTSRCILSRIPMQSRIPLTIPQE